MPDITLSQHAASFLAHLRRFSHAPITNQEAADELVSNGLAAHVPGTGTVEITEAGRQAPFGEVGDIEPSHPAGEWKRGPEPSLIPRMDGHDAGPAGVGRSGLGSDGPKG